MHIGTVFICTFHIRHMNFIVSRQGGDAASDGSGARASRPGVAAAAAAGSTSQLQARSAADPGPRASTVELWLRPAGHSPGV